MNAINTTETQAIDTAPPETVAPAQAPMLVPLSQLRVSKRNVRKTKTAAGAASSPPIQRLEAHRDESFATDSQPNTRSDASF